MEPEQRLRRENADLTIQIAALSAELAKTKRELDVKSIALRRANGWLADRIRDVDRLAALIVELTGENIKLREGLNVPPTEVPRSRDFDTLEHSRDSRGDRMKEIIQKMRQQVHEIGVERYRKWWDGLTPEQQKQQRRGILDAEIGEAEVIGEYKPGVIELDPEFPPTPYAVQMQLMMLGVFTSLSDLAERTREELEIAALWAATAMLSASDNDVIISPRPEWLPGRDSAQIVELVQADIEKHGGEDEVRRIFGDDWYGDAVVDEQPEPFQVGDLESRLSEIVDSLRMMPPPETTAANADWLEQWLARGCPMFDPPETAAHDSLDTSVDEDISTEIQDGNDSIAREPDVFDKHPGRPERFADRPVDVDSGNTSSS